MIYELGQANLLSERLPWCEAMLHFIRAFGHEPWTRCSSNGQHIQSWPLYFFLSEKSAVFCLPTVHHLMQVLRGCVWYGTYRGMPAVYTAGVTNFGKFCTTWIPVPPVPVKTFIPVPDTLVSSIRHEYRYRALR